MMFPSRPLGDDPPEYGTEVEPYHEPSDLEQIMGDKTLQWRCKRLLDHGMPIKQARVITLDRSIDIHYVIERLIKRGCPPQLAYEIVT